MRRCSPLPSQWHRYSITTFDTLSSGPHHCNNSSHASSPASSEVSRPPFICPVHHDAVLFFYLYPHASAPLRAPCLRNWLSVVSLAVPCCYYHRMYLLCPENAFCTLSVDHSVSVIQSSTEGLEEGSQLLDGSTPAVNYQIRARSSSQNAHVCYRFPSLHCWWLYVKANDSSGSCCSTRFPSFLSYHLYIHLQQA